MLRFLFDQNFMAEAIHLLVMLLELI